MHPGWHRGLSCSTQMGLDAFGGVTQSQPWRQVGQLLCDFLALRVSLEGAS